MKKSAIISMFLVSVYILKLSWRNELIYYIHPRYVIFAVVCAVLCIFIVGGVVVFRKRFHWDTQTLIFPEIILICILICAIVIPARPLGSISAANRFLAGQISNITAQRITKSVTTSDTSPVTIRDWIGAFSAVDDLSPYEGKDIDVVGFLYPTQDKPHQEFYISRFIVWCCIVDATPIGIRVQASWEGKYKQDDWLHIVGKIRVRKDADGEDEAFILPSVIEKTTPPDNPYFF